MTDKTMLPSLDPPRVDELDEATDFGSIGPKCAKAETLAAKAALIRAALSVPAEPDISLRALVVSLKADLLQAHRAGRSWKAIAEHFADAGITADPNTIRLYVRNATPTRAARAAKQKPMPAKPPVPPAVVTPSERPSGGHVTTRSDGARLVPRVR